jgi:hypothetical protein
MTGWQGSATLEAQVFWVKLAKERHWMIRLQAAVYFVSALLLPGLAGCDDDCTTYSMNRFNCSQIEKASYNVYFNLPDNSELSLGQASGLSNCAAKASDYANQHSVPKQYYCCMVTETSACAEKHK